MRTFAIYGATLAVVGVLGAGLGACSDGSGALTGGGVDPATGNTGNTSAGTPSTTGGASTIPSTGGSGPGTAGSGVTPGAGTGPVTGTGGTSDPGTGGVPATTGGTGTGTGGTGTGGVAPMGGTGTGGVAPMGGTGAGGAPPASGPFKILIISTTLEFAHDSIPDCQQMVADLGKADPNNSWTTKVEPDNLADFTATGLKDYGMIFSCNPTGRVFSGGSTVADKAGAMKAFQDFIETDGKGFAGVHSASDFEKTNGFPWFTNNLMGGYFNTHDNDGTSGSVISDTQNMGHSVLTGQASTYSTSDEWYKMNKDPASSGFKILQRLASDSRPLTWVKDVGKGRMFYTVRGHAKKVYKEEPFKTLVKNGILWATKRIN